MKISDYLTSGQAAKFLGISKSTLINYEKQKKIYSYRNPLNDYKLYLKTDLQIMLDKIYLSGKDKREFFRR